EFSELEEDLGHLDTEVLGISRDDCISHAAFRDKHGLSVRLLADTEGEMCEKYGVWQEKEKDGVKKMGIVRSTFIIDKRGVLRHALYSVNPRGHAAEAMRLVKTMEQA
ncbi:MAG: peroxiredoxin, partial [Sulfurimicrobium sp.]|nr:peroxiredoxin [Sulfurimicrobium sp.]